MATRLKDARTAAGLTQQVLATKAELATRTVARIEAGEDATVGTMKALALALGIPVTDLIPSLAESGAA